MSYFRRLSNVFRLPRLEREFDDEIRFHLDERARRNRAAGMSAEDAERAASVRFGSVDRARRGMRAAPFVPSRSLGAAALAIAVAIGATGYWRSGDRVYDLTSDVTPPVPVSGHDPEYTAEARQAKIQGAVRVRCVVRTSGLCSDIVVVRSLDRAFGLDAAAVSGLRDWRFRPALRHGRPVATRIDLEVGFHLR